LQLLARLFLQLLNPGLMRLFLVLDGPLELNDVLLGFLRVDLAQLNLLGALLYKLDDLLLSFLLLLLQVLHLVLQVIRLAR